MKILIDMNLSPRWVALFRSAGIEANHWSAVGARDAPDTAIMAYAANNDWIVLTSDLDFSSILAATRGGKPSVVQIRAKDVIPSALNIDPGLTPTRPLRPQGRRGALRRRYESPLRPRGRRGRVRWGHARVRHSNRWYKTELSRARSDRCALRINPNPSCFNSDRSTKSRPPAGTPPPRAASTHRSCNSRSGAEPS